MIEVLPVDADSMVNVKIELGKIETGFTYEISDTVFMNVILLTF